MTSQDKSGYNELTIQVYTTSSSTTLVKDYKYELPTADNIQFSSGYPGGLYLDASFFVPRNVLDYWPLKGGQRVTIRNKTKIVYEGYIADIIDELGATEQGKTINTIGAWSHIAMNRRWRKRWADDRVDNFTWLYAPPPITTSSVVGEPMLNVSRLTDAGPALLFTPTGDAEWGNGEYAVITYTMPGGETVSRITYDYDLQEGAQAWEISLARSTDGSSYTQMNAGSGETWNTGTTSVITSSATGSIDVELATPSQFIRFQFVSRAAQTPTGDGTEYAEFSNIMVKSEIDDEINMEEIAKDVVAGLSELNSDTSNIDTPSTTLALEPFMADNFETTAWILDEITNRGDGDNNRWAAQFLHSENATTPNGEPVLSIEQFPVLTSYDFVVRLDEENIEPPLSIAEDTDAIRNYIFVRYTDPTGKAYYRVPATVAALTDSDSVSDYGQKDGFLDLGPSTQTIADNVGPRYLATYKDPQYRVDGPITVTGYIRAKNGRKLPVSEIVAGRRIKIENYIENKSGTGLTLLITRTRYDDETETCQMYFGDLDTMVFPQTIFKPVGMAPGPRDGGNGASDSGVKEPDRLNWKRKFNVPESEWGRIMALSPGERFQEKMKWKKKWQSKG